MAVPYFGSDISYCFMLLNKTSKIKGWYRLFSTPRLQALQFEWPKFNLPHINIEVKALPVFWSYEWQCKNDNEKMKSIYSLFGFHNHILGSSLCCLWVIRSVLSKMLIRYISHRWWLLLFLWLTPKNVKNFVKLTIKEINPILLSFKIFCFLFCFSIWFCFTFLFVISFGVCW